MATRIVDLSMTTDSDPSPLMNVSITHLDHEAGAKEDQKHYDIDPQDWPFPGKAYADDFIEMTTHAGTHLDAPYHMAPESEGKPAKTIDQIPLEWCMGDGVVLDIERFPDGHEITVDEVKAILDGISYELKEGDIPLTHTGNDKFWGTEEYSTRGGHLGRDALKWILDHGIKLVGTDSWSFDRAYEYWSKDYHDHGRDSSYLWPCHLLCIEKEYCHVEKLANLDTLPPHGFKFQALPIKFAEGTAGYVRAVAFVEE
jgi:kynurenine formamidase